MSAIAGTLARRGAPLARGRLDSLSAGLAFMGPDGEYLAHTPDVGMAFRPFYTDPASAAAQPLVTPAGWMVTLEGRLDNAPEVWRALGEAPDTHPALVLAVYRRWGVEGFGRLVGDFALALWDAAARRLVLAVDGMGRRPLFYHLGEEQVYWASACRPLREAAGLPLAIDDEYVASFLVSRPVPRSPFRGISQLAGGHALVVDPKGAALKRYWAFDPNATVRYGTDAAYEEHFADLFREAVACRMQTDSTVFSELSGGLDSSSIVCVGDRLVGEGSVRAEGLRTVSFVFDGAGSSDERPYLELVEAQVGRRGIHISDTEHRLLERLPAGFAPDLPTSQIAFLSRQDRVTREMAAAGSRVLLCGIGGDQLFWSQPPAALPLADLAARGRLVELLRQTPAWAHSLRWPMAKTLLMGGVWPLVPRRLRALTQRDEPLGEWLAPEFVQRMGMRDRFLGMPDDVGFALPSGRQQYGLIRRSMRVHTLEWCSSEGYVDIRYPYLDRRLTEFALALPLDQKVRPGETRSIVRRGFAGVLPEEIRKRRSKSGPAEAFLRAVIREWPWISKLLPDLRIAAHGFIDGGRFATAMNRARHGLASNQVQLLSALSLELWLRSLETPEPAPRTLRAAPAVAYAGD